MSANNEQKKEPQLQVIYRAVGWVAGIYKPSEEKFYQGVFVTEDGLSIPAALTRLLQNRLKKEHLGYATQPDFFKQSFRWTVYPKTAPIEFHLAGMRPLTPVPVDAPGLDSFRVVGLIKSCIDGVVTVRIQRNQQPPSRWKHNREWKPVVLTLEGSLPTQALGQIWDLELQLTGEQLVVKAGRPYEPSAQDLAWLVKQRSIVEKAAKFNNRAVATTDAPSPGSDNETQPEPVRKPPVQQVGASPSSDSTSAPPESSSTAPTPAAANVDTNLTTGKMEVVVKLNQFPDDVRTVDNGWKEFEVDTGSVMVTVTVKPKMFAQLEQAQQTYPSWVAALSGSMGEITATGFRLESPQIKVFERKAQDTSLLELSTVTDNSSSSPATESQASPAGETQKQQTASKPKAESPSQPTLAPNPMQRPKEHLKQQRPTKRPKNLEKNQPHDQVSPNQKQPVPKTEPKSEPPRFAVTVNGKVIRGRDSVTLNKRLLCVDGVPVGQAKMVVVLGQPRTVQADGGVSQGGNQVVLTSI